MKFGDICLINFDPSVGREYKKVRPAIVVQTETISKDSPYVTVMPISSKLEKLFSPEVPIFANKDNKLMSDSVIKVRQISSFDKKRIIKVFGRANSAVTRKVRGYIRRHFGL